MSAGIWVFFYNTILLALLLLSSLAKCARGNMGPAALGGLVGKIFWAGLFYAALASDWSAKQRIAKGTSPSDVTPAS